MKQIILFLCLIVAVAAYAQMPRTLNYQGTLATGSTPVPDGNYNVTFRLYTSSSGGSAVWTEAQLISTRNGVFNAILGKIVALPASFNIPYWVSLQVGADPELAPRLEMTGVAHSMYSAVADSAVKIADNSVTSAKIVDGTIATADLANNSVTSAKIAGGGPIPIAFAFISTAGTKLSGTSNVTCTWDATFRWYVITISGEYYYYTSYATIVTPTSQVTVMTGSTAGQLIVQFANLSGTTVQSGFQFVTFKP